jgi:hypothetical protein
MGNTLFFHQLPTLGNKVGHDENEPVQKRASKGTSLKQNLIDLPFHGKEWTNFFPATLDFIQHVSRLNAHGQSKLLPENIHHIARHNTIKPS